MDTNVKKQSSATPMPFDHVELTGLQRDSFNTTIIEEIAKDIIRHKVLLDSASPNAIPIPTWMCDQANDLALAYIAELQKEASNRNHN